MKSTNELLLNRSKDHIWSKYCGFLDLTVHEFMAIQERLLQEQISTLSKSPLGEMLFKDKPPQNVEEFRRCTPITSYEFYEPYLSEKREDLLPEKAYLWAHTSGRSGRLKWIPYTEQAYRRLGERVLAGVILATARGRGDICIEAGDTLVYNTPPRPYVSGLALRALAEHFDFKFVPSLEETEDLSFQQRIEIGFETGLVTGIDVLGSMSVVLVKMGERFAEGARSGKLSKNMLHPSALLRLTKGMVRSKLEGRHMLPKDLWRIKGLPCGGTDTSIYKDRIAHYWGVTPYEQYGSTEEGAIAGQAWNKKGMTFFPDAVFLEFIPEAEWARNRREPGYVPQTVLYDEVKPGERYEVLISNFYGKPLVRYHTHDLVRFTSLEDEETGIKLPQMVFAGRARDIIDLAGFTGLIDEKLVWQAIVNTGIRFEEWIIRKEFDGEHPYLHLYIELQEPVETEVVRTKVENQMKELNRFYADYTAMIGAKGLEVTLLSQGVFQAYMKEMQAAGADLAHLKPAHMNPSEATLSKLLRLNSRS